jgi:HTH-type transcriptional regulator/antitoxin HigA
MKLIKTATDHAAALEALEALMIANPPAGSEDSEKIELLGFLIENYEQKQHPIAPPHPVEAIRFAMDQQDLKQVDLVPFIGSKGRVSEILSGKRELTLNMVRELHNGLRIPLKSLVNDPEFELPERIEVSDYPVKAMFDAGYFKSEAKLKWTEVKDRLEELLHEFFAGRENDPIGALNRQTSSKKSKVDQQALHAWRCRVLDRASALDLPTYDPSALNEMLVGQLKALSALPSGPVLVRDRLHGVGIAMITEEHLPKTLLDGAAMMHPKGFPVIALTLRYDRLDNFWFTLFHELGHVMLHLQDDPEGFLDTDIDSQSTKTKEKEADAFALNSFIPPEQWEEVRYLTTAREIRAAANSLSISSAILAGRLRRDARDYRKHRTLIGQGAVKCQFETIN